jgi:hypothetical protein
MPLKADPVMYAVIGLGRALWWGPLFPLAIAVYGCRMLGEDPSLGWPGLDMLFIVPIFGLIIWAVFVSAVLHLCGVIHILAE